MERVKPAEKRKYSNLRAMLAIAVGSLKSILRNPSSLVFGLIFPLVMVVIFGFIGEGGFSLEVGLAEGSDTDNPIHQALEESETVEFVTDKTEEEMLVDLEKGRIDAIMNISATEQGQFQIDIDISDASQGQGELFVSTVSSIADKMNLEFAKVQSPLISISSEKVADREYKSIDFILPGQLGFSLLAIGIMSTAFTFLFLRKTLVLKRFYATPIKRQYIVLGEAISKLLYSMIQVSIIIAVGVFFMEFTLVNGFATFLQMLGLCFLGLIVFMGIGFFISGISKDEAGVAPLGNLFMMPQFLLAGTFFPIEFFPTWLQPVSKVLPLTYLNDAMRKVAFEGGSIAAIQKELIVLVIWGILAYLVAIKFFKWE